MQRAEINYGFVITSWRIKPWLNTIYLFDNLKCKSTDALSKALCITIMPTIKINFLIIVTIAVAKRFSLWAFIPLCKLASKEVIIFP